MRHPHRINALLQITRNQPRLCDVHTRRATGSPGSARCPAPRPRARAASPPSHLRLRHRGASEDHQQHVRRNIPTFVWREQPLVKQYCCSRLPPSTEIKSWSPTFTTSKPSTGPPRPRSSGRRRRFRFRCRESGGTKDLLADRNPASVGIDTESLDHGLSKDFMTHRILNGANIYGLEKRYEPRKVNRPRSDVDRATNEDPGRFRKAGSELWRCSHRERWRDSATRQE